MSLGLEEALRMALERNPDLQVLRRSEGISEAALQVARTYPYNPELTVDVRPYVREAGGARGDTLISTALLEEFELVRKGLHRRRAAAADLDRTHWDLREAELRVLAETERRFFNAIHSRQRLELDRQMAALKEEVLGIVGRRFEAGLAPLADLALAKIEAPQAREEAALSESAYQTAVQELKKELGLESPGSLEPSGALEGYGWAPLPLDTREGADLRPDVQAAQADVEASQARADLATANRIPNVKVGPLFERDEAATIFLGLEAKLPLPILRTGGPEARLSQAHLGHSQEALAQTRSRARLEVEAARARYERARALVESFRVGAAVGLKAEVDRVFDQYQAGQTDIVKVYLARENFVKAEKSHLDALHELGLAAADLTAAAGLLPQALVLPAPKPESPPGAGQTPRAGEEK